MMKIGSDKQFQDHKECCRCCLKRSRSKSQLSYKIRQHFIELTSLELIDSGEYSNFVCDKCVKKLAEFSNLQTELIERQTKLYQFVGKDAKKVVDDSVIVKVEYLDLSTYNLESYRALLTDNEGTQNTNLVQESENSDACFENGTITAEEDDQFSTIYPSNEKENFDSNNKDIEADSRPKVSVDGNGADKSSENTETRRLNEGKITTPTLQLLNCAHCDEQFTTQAMMTKHLKIHVASAHQSLKKSLRQNKVESIPKFRNHSKLFRSSHQKIHRFRCDQEKKFKCFVCDKKFFTKRGLLLHLDDTHSELNKGEFLCKCGKIFQTAYRLKRHENRIHSDKEYPCNMCTKIFLKQTNLTNHKTLYHNPRSACKICGKMIPPGWLTTKHLKLHEAPLFKCGFEGCSKEYHIKLLLKKHIASRHEPDKKVVCSKCQKTFQSIYALKHHQKVQHRTKDIVCKVKGCNYKAVRKDYMKKHYRSLEVHKNLSDKTRQKLLEGLKGQKRL